MYAQLSLIVISLHLLFILPTYHAQFDGEKLYLECNKTFNCGKNVTEIGYPFWGGDRPKVCGLEVLALSCENEEDGNEFATLHIGSEEKFRVQHINTSIREIIMERADPVWRDDCPEEFDYETLFDYGRDTKDLHVFYDCPTGINAPAVLNYFPCKMSLGNDTVGFFGNESLLSQLPSLQACGMKVRVPVNRTVLEEFKSNATMELQELLNPSFVVFYKINEVECSVCKNSGGLCGWNNNNPSDGFLCLCRDGPYPHPCPKASGWKNSVALRIGIGIGAPASAMLLLLFVYCLRRYLPNNLAAFGKTKSDKDVEAFIRQYGFSTPKRYKYATLKSITNSFKHEVGKGGYGNVYKGKLPDDRVVAVKILNVSKGKGEEFINEVASIGRTSHVNVVTLLGFCYEGKRRALIYEFMPNGSLEKFIYGENFAMGGQHLGCEKLYNIALGIARGLEYLHQGCNTRIVHFDIKPHNILLDEDFCPKISDFGLAKLYTRKESIISMMEARGTIGYIAPEVFSRNFGKVSHKSDVYSYGMMILEMVGGRKNVDAGAIHTSEIYFPHWIYDHIELNKELNLVSAMTVEENEIAKKMIIVGLWCIQTDPSQRPSISKVIEMLEGSIGALEIPPKPYLCSPRSGSNS